MIATTGVEPGDAGLASGLFNTAQQVGGALGLAIFSAIATSRINDLLAAHTTQAVALTSGFQRALLASSIFLAAAALVGLRVANTRGEEHQPPADAPATADGSLHRAPEPALEEAA